MKYDLTDIPAAYDRARDHGPEVLDLWMNVVASRVHHTTVETILDLGCGTGRFSEGLATRFDACVVGIDPSKKMLDRARAKRRGPSVHCGRGTAEAVPVADQAVDVVFMSMSYHHFRDPQRAARECRRVLRPGGTVIVRTGTLEQIRSYPYVPFFPRAHSLLRTVLPDRISLSDVFEGAGFARVGYEVITQTVAPSWAAYVEKVAAGGDSVLARLSEEEFTSGLEALRSHDAGPDGGPVVEPIDVFCFR